MLKQTVTIQEDPDTNDLILPLTDEDWRYFGMA